MAVTFLPEKTPKDITVLLISEDGLSKMMEVPETTQGFIETVLGNGRRRKYLYCGYYDGNFTKRKLIKVFKEEI